MWVDTHAHLNDPAFAEDCHQVIALALEADVGAIVVAGYDLSSSRRAVALAEAEPRVWAAVGIHPHDAKNWNQQTAASLEALLKQPKVVALGEIGLDYHYDYATKTEQAKAFMEQLVLAKEYHKPVIIHDREAHQDILGLIKKVQLGPEAGVLHCFSGSHEMALEAIRLGLYISVAGPVTFANATRLRETVGELPLERLLVETDAPYLTPHPYRGERNQPARVGLVGAKLAEIQGVTIERMAEVTTKNAVDLFKISLTVSCGG